MSISEITIANRALQKCGSSVRIASLTEQSVEAKAIVNCYDMCLRSELQTNAWNFAITRGQLAALSEAPSFGRLYQFQLPANYVRRVPLQPEVKNLPDDILEEGRRLLSDDPGPLYIRYIRNDSPVAEYDPLFQEALSARIAIEIVDELAQSQNRKQNLQQDYVYWVTLARQRNAIENGAPEHDIDEWEYVRL